MTAPSSPVPLALVCGPGGPPVDGEEGVADRRSVATVPAVEERAIVEAMRAGDPGGLAAAYEGYNDRLYDYCASLLHDPEGAADALHDTLLVAGQRIDQLRDPERLRAWLYAIARNECLRQLRLRQRSVALEAAAELSDESVDLDAGPRREELQALVRDAAAGLSPRDREVLDLALRHQLDPAEVAAALGVGQGHARALLSRARDQLERALGAVLVARDGRSDCPERAAILAGWDGQMTALLRKRLNRHLETCELCADRRRRLASAPALFGSLPLLLPPPDLRARVLSDAFDPKLVGHRAELGHRAGRLNRDGFPARPRLRLGPRPLAAAAMIVAVLGAGVFAVTHSPGQVRSLVGTPAASPSPSGSGGASGTGPSGGPAQGAAAGAQQVLHPSGARQATPAARPQLVVQAEIDLHTASASQLQISATGADLDWTATVRDRLVTLKPASGRATTGAGSAVLVAIPAQRHAGRATITFTYPGGSATTLVTWDAAPVATARPTATPSPSIIP